MVEEPGTGGGLVCTTTGRGWTAPGAGGGGGGGVARSCAGLATYAGAGGGEGTHSSLGAEGGGGPSGDAELGVHAGCGRLVFARNIPLITVYTQVHSPPPGVIPPPPVWHLAPSSSISPIMHAHSVFLVHRHVL